MQQAFKEKEVLQEIRTAYSKFITFAPRQATSGSFAWKAPAHRCEQTCDFFMHRNVVICKTTHNWHYCTKDTCDRMIKNHECQVCPLSGMAYDLDFEFEEYGVNYHADTNGVQREDDDDDAEAAAERPEADDYGDETIEPVVKQEHEDAPLPKRRKRTHHAAATTTAVTVGISQTDEEKELREEEREAAAATRREEEQELELKWAPQISPQPPPPPLEEATEQSACERRIDMANHNQRLAMFETMMRRLFAKHIQTHASLCSTVAANAERLWALIQMSETITRKKHRYQTEYHLLVVVYNMCHGYNCMQRSIVPLNEWIRTNIPQVRDLKRMNGLAKSEVKVKNWTQASKMFKVCIAELVRGGDEDIMRRLAWIA